MPDSSQILRIVKSRQDIAMDVGSAAVFMLLLFFVLNPEAYDKITGAINSKLNSVSHRISVWQTKLSIRSLPETDEPS